MKYLSCTFVVVDEGTEVAVNHVGGVAFCVDGLDDEDLEAVRERLTFMFRREAGQEIDARLKEHARRLGESKHTSENWRGGVGAIDLPTGGLS